MESLLEIGSRFGYPLVDLAHALKPGSRVVSVDLPDAEGWNDSLSREAITHLRLNIAQLKSEGYDAHLIEGDSRAPSIIDRAKALGPYDAIFIDGGHDEKTVRSDWMNYGPLGKRIMFHDIRQPQPPEDLGVEVWKVWGEIRAKPQVEEFIANGSKMGIGRIDVA